MFGLGDDLEEGYQQENNSQLESQHINPFYLLKCQSRQLMHWDTLKQGNYSTVRGDGGSRVGEVRAGTTSPMPEHKGFMLQQLSEIHLRQQPGLAV